MVFGESASESEMQVNEHLATCAGCREEERRLRTVHQLLRREPAAPGEALRARTRAALPRRQPHGLLAALRRPVPAYVAVVIGLAGALLAVIPYRVERAAPRPAQPESTLTGVVITGPTFPFEPALPVDTDVSSAALRSSPRDSGQAGRRTLKDST